MCGECGCYADWVEDLIEQLEEESDREYEQEQRDNGEYD